MIRSLADSTPAHALGQSMSFDLAVYKPCSDSWPNGIIGL